MTKTQHLLTITFEAERIDSGSLYALKEAVVPLIPRELGPVVGVLITFPNGETSDLLWHWESWEELDK